MLDYGLKDVTKDIDLVCRDEILCHGGYLRAQADRQPSARYR